MVNDDTLGFWARDERRGAIKYSISSSIYRIKKAVQDVPAPARLAISASMAAVAVVAIKARFGR